MGAARVKEVAVGSCLGPKAEAWQQVLLFLGASSVNSSRSPAAPYTRKGVAVGKVLMSTFHQVVPVGGVWMGR